MLAALLAIAPVTVAPADLDHILDDTRLAGAHASVYVCDLGGKPIFERNSSSRVMPASNQKLLTCAFALFNLGPNYKPRTDIWKFPDRTIVDSPGDPLMTHDLLKKAAQRLELDPRSAVYVRQAYAPGIPDSWEIDDLPNRYAAPVTAFTVDQGSFTLWNENGIPKLLPESYGVRIDHLLPQEPKFTSKYDPFQRRVQVIGTLPQETKAVDTLALARPDEAAASLLGRYFLTALDRPTRTPDLTIVGQDTAAMLGACLPPSDNNIAENLFLMGARSQGELGSNPYATARPRMTNFLTRVVGILPSDLRIFDGSGMSRHNLATTRGIAKLLVWANAQPTSGVWLNSLATTGKGTLGNRLKGLDFRGKTGTLDMVVALSGYLKVKSGRTLVVSVVLNDFLCASDEARSIADEFVKILATEG